MAHTCPECGMSCYCKGDIDDIDFGERWDCECEYCQEQEHDEEYDYYYDDDEWYEDNADSKPQ